MILEMSRIRCALSLSLSLSFSFSLHRAISTAYYGGLAVTAGKPRDVIDEKTKKETEEKKTRISILNYSTPEIVTRRLFK